jgi:hypothetical protein
MKRLILSAIASCLFSIGCFLFGTQPGPAATGLPPAAPPSMHVPTAARVVALTPNPAAAEAPPQLAALNERLAALHARLSQLASADERKPKEDWFGEQRSPIMRGLEDHGVEYQRAFAQLRSATKLPDARARERAIHALADRYPGTYLAIVGKLVLAEQALREERPADALELIDDELQSAPPETADNLSIRLQVDLVKGIALATAGREQEARALLERAAASSALGPDADHYRVQATQALLRLEGPGG